MKSFASGFITGIAVMVLAFIADIYRDKKAPADVTVKQISGEKIDHSGFDYKSGSIKFATKAEGKGEITTEIPKVNIPEARAWMQDTNGIMLELLLTEKRMYGMSYMKRWDNISVGGGILVSGDKFEGVKVQTEYWFGL